jgi:hypothetical protein
MGSAHTGRRARQRPTLEEEKRWTEGEIESRSRRNEWIERAIPYKALAT